MANKVLIVGLLLAAFACDPGIGSRTPAVAEAAGGGVAEQPSGGVDRQLEAGGRDGHQPDTRRIKHDIGEIYREQESVFFSVPITIRDGVACALRSVTRSCGCTAVQLVTPQLGKVGLSALPIALVAGEQIIVEASTLVPAVGDLHGSVVLVCDNYQIVIDYVASVSDLFQVSPAQLQFGRLAGDELFTVRRSALVKVLGGSAFNLVPRFSRDWLVSVNAVNETRTEWRVHVGMCRVRSGTVADRITLDSNLGVPVTLCAFGDIVPQVFVESGRVLYLGRVGPDASLHNIVVRDRGGSQPVLTGWEWKSETGWNGDVSVVEVSRGPGVAVLGVAIHQGAEAEDHRIRGILRVQCSASEMQELKISLIGWDGLSPR